MKLLVLGGTVFLGRHVVDAAVARGHEVTVFNRGRSEPGPPPQVERLTGDRVAGEIDALRRRTWDAAVDTSGYFPAHVCDAAAALREGGAGHLTFVSSVSAYAGFSQPGMDEHAPLHEPAGADVAEVTETTYGPLKVACERAAHEVFGDRALIVRPGIIVGPGDPIARFTYWVRRVARGGSVLAPGHPDARVQLIDARDLADWVVSMAERGAGGTFNAVGPDRPLTFGRMLAACRHAAGSQADFRWVADEALVEAGVEPFSELPLWVPATDPDAAGFYRIDNRRAVAAGLGFRPLVATARDLLDADESGAAVARTAPGIGIAPTARGLDPEREQALLAELAAA